MELELDCKQLKQDARDAIAITQPKAWVVALAYLLLTTVAALVVQFIPIPAGINGITLSVFLGALLNLLLVILAFGHNLWCLWAVRREHPGMGALLDGFSIAGRVIWMELSILIRTIGWSFLLIFLPLTVLLLVIPPYPPILFAFFFLAYGATWLIMLRYALSPYLLADRPEDGAQMAVLRSVALMRGWKWELFKLEVSFLGWVLLVKGASCAVLGFLLWQNGFFELMLSSDLLSVQAIWFSTIENVWASCLISLLTLPVLVFLLPYRGAARARFYVARSQLQQEDISVE